MNWAHDFTVEARGWAEELMTDRAEVGRPTGRTVTDPVTGEVAPELVPVPFGSEPLHPCKVQTTVAQAASPEAGGHAFTVEQLQMHFPVASLLQSGDVVTIRGADDPQNDGLVFRLVELARGTYRTARRWNVELVTA